MAERAPCIVDASANIALAAKRIVWGKYLNCGQTCVAPDYVLCEKSVKDAFVAEVVKQIKKRFGEKPLANPDYGKIINEKHFQRLCWPIDPEKVVFGGETDESVCRISPTLMDKVTCEDAVIGRLKETHKPLALYLFSGNKAHIRRVREELFYGGGCINDVVIHLAISSMGFGGVGASGMGAYHGRAGFEAFSHTKSIVDKKTWMDLPMRYQPFKNKLYEALLHIFLR